MTDTVLVHFAKRHSFYDIDDHIPIRKNEIIRIIKKTLELYPSSFNTQGARLLLLFGKEHEKFWNLVQEELLKNSPSDKSEAIKKRIASFIQGGGSILFFDDRKIVKQLETKMPLYSAYFTDWANQGNAILQFMIWTALAERNVGSSLQHYNPLIDNAVKKVFDIPKTWELVAQMPFGGIKTYPKAHDVEDIESKLIIKK